MPDDFLRTMKQATRATRAGNPTQATRLIQEALRGRGDAAPAEADYDGVTIEGRVVQDNDSKGRSTQRGATGASMLTRSFYCKAGARDYRLFLPSTAPDGVRGLVMMLHGCSQNADDFARGTAMNDHAEKHGLIVAYPCQTTEYNAHGCWNWFEPGNQMRGAGEPAILAGIAQEIAATHGVPEGAVFVAGLSAGGAMAAVLGATYPDVFSAIGVHSGLAAGAANTVTAAFGAMQGKGGRATLVQDASGAAPRVMVIHGTADSTVSPVNGAHVLAAAGVAHPLARRVVATEPDGRTTIVRLEMPDGTVVAEHREVTGLAHAWSGGDAAGSFTAPAAPDASAAMVAFFLGYTIGGNR